MSESVASQSTDQFPESGSRVTRTNGRTYGDELVTERDQVRVSNARAACAERPDWWLSGVRADRERAVAICHTCPLEQSCRDGAVARRLFDAVRGGLTGPELRKLAGPARRTVLHNRARYISGQCDCARCRAANAAYQRSWRARHVTQRPTMFVELPGGQLALRLEDRPC